MYVANKQSVQYADEDFVLEAEFALRSALLVRDYEAADFGKTMLDVFQENGKKVLAIGKIEYLF